MFYYFILFSCLTASLFSQNAPSSEHIPVLELVRDIMEEEIEKLDIPGVALALYHNDHEYFLSFGLANREKKTLVAPDTLFKIASITKVFTSTLLAIKIIDGKIQYTDSAAKYLNPESANPKNDLSKVTLINLATHTSSFERPLPSDKDLSFNNEKKIIDYLNNWKAPYPIASRYSYSNFGFGILGMALAHENHSSYIDLLNTFILKPLNMNSTFLEVPKRLINDIAVGYTHNGAISFATSNQVMPASGSLYSTAQDMLKFLKANMIIDRHDKLNIAMQYAQNEFFSINKQLSIGLGWQRFTTQKNLLIIEKNGGLAGFSSYIGFTKNDKKAGIVILMNQGEVNTTAIGRRILTELQK